MNYEQLAKQIIDSNNGIAKLSKLIAEGLPREKIYEMYSTGYLQRVSQGYYRIIELQKQQNAILKTLDSAEYSGSVIILLNEGVRFIERNMKTCWKKMQILVLKCPITVNEAYLKL